MGEVIAALGGLSMLGGAYLYGIHTTRRYYRTRVVPEVFQDGVEAGIREAMY